MYYYYYYYTQQDITGDNADTHIEVIKARIRNKYPSK